jgi:AraC-like DNA-binding protein
MVRSRHVSYDSCMSASELATLLSAVIPDAEGRELVLAVPTPRPPPAGAWAPGVLAVQLPISGQIELAIPDGASERWQVIDRRHLLVVCPGAWSPRTHNHARRHLALDLGPALGVSCYRTPLGGASGGPEFRAAITAPGPLLVAAREAAALSAEGRARPEVIRPLVLALLPLLVDELTRMGSPPGDDVVAAIRAELRARCHEDLQRAELAARFGIGGDHLARLLRQQGAGFMTLLMRYRLERAREQLRRSDATVAEIAQACGFGSATWFIRCFRRVHATTPAAWRRAWQRAGSVAS